eukprot:2174302-Alexandrium_andersonii.AAC.1
MGASCAVFRGGAGSADEAGQRARQRRFSGGPGGWSNPGKPCTMQRDIDRTESIDGIEHDRDRTDRT